MQNKSRRLEEVEEQKWAEVWRKMLTTAAKRASFKLCSEQKEQGRETHCLEQVGGCSINTDGRAELSASAAPLFSPPATAMGSRIRPAGQEGGWLTEVPQRVYLWCPCPPGESWDRTQQFPGSHREKWRWVQAPPEWTIMQLVSVLGSSHQEGCRALSKTCHARHPSFFLVWKMYRLW